MAEAEEEECVPVRVVVGANVQASVRSILKVEHRRQPHPYPEFKGSDRSESEAIHGRADRSVTFTLPKNYKERETSRRATLSRAPKLSRRGLSLSDLRNVYRFACEHYRAVPVSQMLLCLQDIHGPNTTPPQLVSLEGVQNISFEQFLCVCEVLIQNGAIRALNLTNVGLRDRHMEKLCSVMVFRRSINRLSLAGNAKIGLDGIRYVEMILSRCVFLAMLNLSGIPLNTAMATRLKEGLQRSHLQALVLQRCSLKSGAVLAAIATGVACCSSLVSLSIAQNDITHEGGEWLAGLLRSASPLSLLDVSNNRLGDKGLLQLASGISQNRCLERLVIRQNEFREPGAVHLLQAVRASTSLIYLDASHNDFSSDTCHMLLKNVLVQSPRLQVLILQHARIPSEGAIALAEALSENTVLREIDLEGNDVSAAGLLAFSLTMRLNKNITRLNVDRPFEPRRDRADQQNEFLVSIATKCAENEARLKATQSRPPINIAASLSTDVLDDPEDIENDPHAIPTAAAAAAPVGGEGEDTDESNESGGHVALVLENVEGGQEIMSIDDGDDAEPEEPLAPPPPPPAAPPPPPPPAPMSLSQLKEHIQQGKKKREEEARATAAAATAGAGVGPSENGDEHNIDAHVSLAAAADVASTANSNHNSTPTTTSSTTPTNTHTTPATTSHVAHVRDDAASAAREVVLDESVTASTSTQGDESNDFVNVDSSVDGVSAGVSVSVSGDAHDGLSHRSDQEAHREASNA